MKSVRNNEIILAVMVVVLLVGAFYTWRVVEKRNTVELQDSSAFSSLGTTGEQSPYTDLYGNTIVLSDYIGEVLVVTSWASWCPACATDLPRLSAVATSYESKPVHFLAINRSEPPNTADRYLRTVKATSGVLLILDPDDRFYKSIGGYAMPETVFFDAAGKIVYHARGSMRTEEMRKYIEKALESAPQ